MTADWYNFLALDLPALSAALFSAIACALLGNFLVLRKLSLMGDAISHAVLPGIVIAFLVTGSRASFPIFIGAALAGLLTAALVELVRRLGKLDSGTAMGVVFSILFASGVVLIEQAAARSVDLDADCLLHGQLETIFWHPPQNLAEFFSYSTVQMIPDEVLSSFFVMLICIVGVWVFFKELTIVSFDAALATALGINATCVHYLMMLLVAAAVVASFEAVGSILVIAMLICPAATARLLTDRLRIQIALSIFFATLSVVAGYLLAAFGPQLLGYTNSVNAAGMIAVSTGLLLATAVIFAPHYGVLGKRARQLHFKVDVLGEDLLAILYRIEESNRVPQTLTFQEARNLLGKWLVFALRTLRRKGEIKVENSLIHLTALGRKHAATIIRTHRLWEIFLVEKVGISPSHVHASAEKLEHVTGAKILPELVSEGGDAQVDPHGKPIPKV